MERPRLDLRVKELMLRRSVESRHRQAPVKKQQTSPVRRVMQSLSAEGLRRIPGVAPRNPAVYAGLVQMLASGRAASTDKAYCNAFERVRAWAERERVSAIPMQPLTFMGYLWELYEHCKQQGRARGNIDMACAAVERFHTLANYPSPTAHAGVQELRKSMGRSLGVRGQQARPLTDEVQERMWKWWLQSAARTEDSLLHLVTLVTVAVMREGVMRWDDVSRVEFRDLSDEEQYARIFVSERKTDARREGTWVMLQHGSSPWSAYQLLQQVRRQLGVEFQKLSRAQRGEWLRDHPGLGTWQSGEGTLAVGQVRVACLLGKVHGAWLPVAAGASMPYNRFQDLFRRLLSFVGEDASMYSTHSMRRGGASELRQCGLSEDLIAQQGGWKSRDSMLKYFDSSVEFERRAVAWREVAPVRGKGGVDPSKAARLQD